ncbi:MAG TPA: hypothetical protein VGE21_12690 [Flavobacteriales bacterium]
MAKKRLNEKDTDQLLAHYRAERRRLSFQLDLVRSAILDLKKGQANGARAASAAATGGEPTKRGPGRPRKIPAVTKSKRGPGRPPKRERKERELNPWDNMVLDTIRNRKRLLPKEDLLKQATVWAKTNQPKVKGAEVEAFLTRTLQKLSGRKKLLGTHHSGLRRGYHYGLKEWFFNSSGKLRRQHFDKLVLDEK